MLSKVHFVFQTALAVAKCTCVSHVLVSLRLSLLQTENLTIAYGLFITQRFCRIGNDPLSTDILS
jgi:hypothetical protein